LYLYSCGGKEVSIVAVVTPSGEFQQFVLDARGMTPAEFCLWWNGQQDKWKFSYYNENGLIWPDKSTAEEIYQSRVINCYRVSKMLQFVYGGELIFVSQPTSNYDHYYLKLPNGDIIDNSGLTLKYKSILTN
jgi:hypothetical protein